MDTDASSPKGLIVLRPLDTCSRASTTKVTNVPSSPSGAVRLRTQLSLASSSPPALTQALRGTDAGANIWLFVTRCSLLRYCVQSERTCIGYMYGIICIGYMYGIICIGYMYWVYVLGICIGYMYWVYVLGICIGYISWVMCICVEQHV